MIVRGCEEESTYRGEVVVLNEAQDTQASAQNLSRIQHLAAALEASKKRSIVSIKIQNQTYSWEMTVIGAARIPIERGI